MFIELVKWDTFGVNKQPSWSRAPKGLSFKNGTVPLGDRFRYYENSILSILKPKEKGSLYGGTERNRCVQTDTKMAILAQDV